MVDIISQINPWLLIAFGTFLMGLEIITVSFVAVFFGLAFIIIGIISFYIEISGEVQILSAIVLSGVLTFLLRKAILKTMHPGCLAPETFVTGDTGVLSEYNGEIRVNYKGTTWPIQIGAEGFSAGETVIVSEIKNNTAVVTKS